MFSFAGGKGPRDTKRGDNCGYYWLEVYLLQRYVNEEEDEKNKENYFNFSYFLSLYSGLAIFPYSYPSHYLSYPILSIPLFIFSFPIFSFPILP